MVLEIELSADLEARITTLAAERGKSPAEYVRDFLADHTPAPQPAPISAEEFSRRLNALVRNFPDVPVLPDEVWSRESLYTREDEL